MSTNFLFRNLLGFNYNFFLELIRFKKRFKYSLYIVFVIGVFLALMPRHPELNVSLVRLRCYFKSLSNELTIIKH